MATHSSILAWGIPMDRGSLRCLPPLEVRPSSVAPDPPHTRGAPPPPQDPSPLTSVHGDSPGKNTGMGCRALLQGVFLTQGRASPSASQLLAFSPGKEQAAGVWET